MDLEVERVDVCGLVIAYRRAGSGPALVLLHGGYEDSRSWSRQLDGLSDEFTVVAWDAPGCGRSDDPEPGFSAEDYGDVVAGFIDALALPEPHVLGLSWGSTLALAMYERRPGLAASLILASAYAGWAGSLPAEEVERRVRQMLREVELPPEEFVEDWIPTLLTAEAPSDLVQEVGRIMADFHPAGMRAALLGMARADFRPMLGTIAVPTLLLYGEKDVRSPLDVAADLASRIPGAQLVTIPGAPHLSNVETPQAFNDAVRAFLRGVTGGRVTDGRAR